MTGWESRSSSSGHRSPVRVEHTADERRQLVGQLGFTLAEPPTLSPTS
jgi:hypothetical protein